MSNSLIAIAVQGVMPAALATGLFLSTCSISAPTPASGAPNGTYTPVTGLQSIRCMDAPDPFGSRIGATEVKAQSQTESMAMRHVLLDAYYSQLSPNTNWGDIGWRATIVHTVTGSSVVYDLCSAEADSQHIMTRLCLRKVTL